MPGKTVEVEDRTGDMFEDAKPGTVFIHSCNCRGAWGKGIAAEFKKRYPEAFRTHHQFCTSHSGSEILGTSQVIAAALEGSATPHFIACLFTKDHWGPTKSAKQVDQVVETTQNSMQHLLQSLAAMIADDQGTEITELRMPKINAGLFKVPWERTLAVLNELEVPQGFEDGSLGKIVVYSR